MAGSMRSYRMIAVLTAVVSGLVTIAFARVPEPHTRSGPGRVSEVEVAV